MVFAKPAGAVASAAAVTSQPEKPITVKHTSAVQEERVYSIATKAVAVRSKPAEQAARTGEILQQGAVFTSIEALQGDDGRTYLRLAQDRGWLFDDAKIFPDDPAVKLISIGGINMAGDTDKVRAQRDTPVAKILGSIEEHLPGCTAMACKEHTFYFIQIIRGTKESVIDVAAAEYDVLLDRKDDVRLGLKIEVQQTVGCLVVKEVIGGLAAQWNEQHPDVQIRPGDRIVRVNGIDGMPKEAHRLNEECKKREVIKLTMRRGTSRVVMPGLRVTVKKAFGQLREGQEGDVVRVDDDGDSLVKIVGHGQQWVGRENYDCLSFQDVEGFYLKRYEDLRAFHLELSRKVKSGKCPSLSPSLVPAFPADETIGIRRFLSAMSMSSFLQEREAGLQKWLHGVLSQVPSLDSEPLLLQFFGPEPVPPCGSPLLQDALRLRLDALVERVRKQRAERRQARPLN